MKRFMAAALAMLLAGAMAYADEGMWLVQAISRALEADMQSKGLKLSANEIYDADACSLSDAIVSLDFGCTGSMVSDKGLLITNHHCAYADVFALSTPEHNYLEDGYWAMKSSDEVPIAGKKAFFLKKVIDVTDQVRALIAEERAAGRVAGMRRISHLMEERYRKQSGLEASLDSMWGGSVYYISLYEVYEDVRLVAAPPVSIAAFGGDIDNWEWPQQKCDFAMYRIYTAPDGSPAAYDKDNVPLNPVRKLKISTAGYRPGDFTMVMGYPGRTDRYSSSAKVNYRERCLLPETVEVRGQIMKIISSWMNADPSVRLKYADYYFSLSNVQECNAGEALCYGRFGVVEQRRKAEREELGAWIDSDPDRKAKWGNLLNTLDETYAAVEDAERNMILFRETLFRGSRLAVVCARLSSRTRNGKSQMVDTYDELDLRVERDIFRYTLEKFYTSVDSVMWGPYQKQVYKECGGDFDRLACMLWDESVLSDRAKVEELASSEGYIDDDPLFRFYTDEKIVAYRKYIEEVERAKINMPTEDGSSPTLITLGREYTHALYQMRLEKGIPQYPDANSTMRLTYGTVSDGLQSFDGNRYGWQSNTSEILAKENPEQYDYSLKEPWHKLLKKGKWGKWSRGTMPVNFITDNDITGGNSGSPVLNAEGELIGLAFDGNKESLASESSFTEGYNKCVCVDIRFVLWTLDKYANMDYLLREMGL